MTSRITVTCPECNAKLAVGSENVGKRLRCPKCQTIVEVPDGNEDGVVPPTQETTLWKVVVGTKKGGPFGKAKLRQLVDGEKLPGEAFVRDDAGATDWCEVQTIDWLFSVTFHHRSQASKYRAHLPKVERELDARTERLIDALNEFNGLKRSLVRVRSKLVEDTEAEFRQQRVQLADQLETAKDSVNAVHRMAQRFLDEPSECQPQQLHGEQREEVCVNLLRVMFGSVFDAIQSTEHRRFATECGRWCGCFA